ncbi:threonine-type endopeptidase [Aureococcus anophagefferens]|nr:threonine-type endopeptidase [Aureococcus anophagefferens]
MSILQHNGAAIVCMAGKNCVAIASDTRFGLSQQTVSCDFQKVFKQSDRLFVGLAGLATDVQTLRNTLKFKREPALALYELREERVMKPEAFAALLSHMLYEAVRADCRARVAGLKDDGSPFLCGMDLIGAPVYTDDYVVSGTCTPNLNGMCESMWRRTWGPTSSSRPSPSEPIKAALSAYMHFCGDERAAVTSSVKAAEGAAFKQTKVMTKLGELWRALDAATKKASKPKRPLSAYMLFCQERRPALTETLKASLGPGFKYTAVMTKLGEEWRELSDGAKVKYQDMAAAEKAKAA